MFFGEKIINRKSIKISLAIGFVSTVLFSSTAIAAPTTMPYLGGPVGKVQANWSKYGFTKPLKLVQQQPPSSNYECRPPAPNDLILSQDPQVNSAVTADTQVTLTLVCKITSPQNAVVATPYTPPPSTAKPKAATKPGAKPSVPAKTSAPKVSIKCVKGKKTITVTSAKPTCPAGYKKK
jgi:hypothetical protein